MSNFWPASPIYSLWALLVIIPRKLGQQQCSGAARLVSCFDAGRQNSIVTIMSKPSSTIFWWIWRLVRCYLCVGSNNLFFRSYSFKIAASHWSTSLVYLCCFRFLTWYFDSASSLTYAVFKSAPRTSNRLKCCRYSFQCFDTGFLSMPISRDSNDYKCLPGTIVHSCKKIDDIS